VSVITAALIAIPASTTLQTRNAYQPIASIGSSHSFGCWPTIAAIEKTRMSTTRSVSEVERR
jgi:hypothetical protein